MCVCRRGSGNFICLKAERGTVKYYQSTKHGEIESSLIWKIVYTKGHIYHKNDGLIEEFVKDHTELFRVTQRAVGKIEESLIYL